MLGSWFLSEAPATNATLPMANEDWFESGGLPLEWTLARTTEALSRAVDGRWACYAVNVPRPWHDPATLAYRGILVEAAPATQLIYRSRSSTGVVGVTANAATTTVNSTIASPFGTGVTRVFPDTTTAQHGFNFTFGGTQGAEIPDNSTVSLRLVLRPTGTTYTYGRLFLRNRANVYTTVTFQLVGAGSIVSVSSSSATARITPDTDSFYSLEVTMAFGAGTTSAAANLLVLPDTLANSFAGNGTSGFYLAYMGAEVGGSCTSPILTDGTATVTRAADALTSAADWLAPGPKTFGIRYTPLTPTAHVVFHASGPDVLELRRDAAGVTTYAAVTGGATAAQITAATPAAGVEQTAVLVAGLNEFRLAVDGAVLGTDTSGAVPSAITALRVGAGSAGANPGALLLRRMKYWHRALSATAAEAFSEDLSIVGGVVADLPTVDLQPARTVTPSETSVTLLATLTGEPTGPLFTWRTVNGSATAGVDYVGVTETVRLTPGDYTLEMTVTLGDRSADEDRWFAVELVGAEGAVLGNRRCVVTLQHAVRTGPPADVQVTFGETAPPEWSYTRPAAGLVRGADGLWAAAGADAYRHHHVAPGISGLLVQTIASEQRLFDNVDPGWVVAGSTKTLDAVTRNPVGTRTLVWRKATQAAADHSLTVTLTTANAAMPTGEYCLSLTVRPVGERYWKLRLKGIDNVWREVLYDLGEAGAVVSAESGVIARAKRDPFFPEWYEVFANRSQAATAGVNAEIQLVPTDAFGNPTSGGGSGLGIDLAHIQLESGFEIGVPIVPPAGTAALISRTGDALKAAGTWYRRQSYSLGLRYVRLLERPTTQVFLQVRDSENATTTDSQELRLTSGTLSLRPRTGSAALATVNDGAVPVGQVHTTLLTVDHTSRIALFDSGAKVGEVAVGASGGAAPLIPTMVRFGATNPNGLSGASWLLQATYLWNSPLTDEHAILFSGNLAHVPTGEVELPVVSIPTALSVSEGATLAVPITKTGSGACSVRFRTRALSGQATFAVDYTGVDTVVTFLSADTVKSVSVATIADTVADPGETLSILLELPTPAPDPAECTLGNASGIVTILEQPRISMPATLQVNEGSPAVITLTKVGSGACSVTVQTFQQTALTGSDYTGIAATTVSFASADTSKTVSIQTTADSAADPNEYFHLDMSNPVGCTIATPRCVVTIVEAGAEPEPPTGLFAPPRGFATSSSFGIGASGGSYYRVTNLLQGQTGSLDLAFGLSNRVVIFEVGGIIKWNADERITGSNLYIAGETAPYPGITIQGATGGGTAGGTILSTGASRNIKFSHITLERCYSDPTGSGSTLNSNGDCVAIAPGSGSIQYDWWWDHCAFFWSNDECFSLFSSGTGRTHTNTGTHRWDITNSMFCQPLHAPNGGTGGAFLGHWENGSLEEPHGYGNLFGPYAKNVSYQYNMMADYSMRGPFIDHSVAAVLANNLALNASYGATIEMNSGDQIGHKITCVGYLMISGPDRLTPNAGFRFHTYPISSPLPGSGPRYYIHDLYAMRGSATGAGLAPTVVTWNTADGRDPQPEVLLARDATRPIDIPGGATALTAQQIYDRAVANVGPRPKENNGNRANPAVAGAISMLRNKTGKWINHESKAYGGPGKSVLTPTTRALDGTTRYAAGDAIIPAPPDYSDAAAVRAWLREFQIRLQYD